MYKRNGKLKTVQESVKELIGLYTKLGETQRKALVAGDVNKARIAGVLQDAIVKDMSKWKGKGAGIQRKIDEARSFSLLKNKYFKQGSVGEMLGYAKKGELKASPYYEQVDENPAFKKKEMKKLIDEKYSKRIYFKGLISLYQGNESRIRNPGSEFKFVVHKGTLSLEGVSSWNSEMLTDMGCTMVKAR